MLGPKRKLKRALVSAKKYVCALCVIYQTRVKASLETSRRVQVVTKRNHHPVEMQKKRRERKNVEKKRKEEKPVNKTPYFSLSQKTFLSNVFSHFVDPSFGDASRRTHVYPRHDGRMKVVHQRKGVGETQYS